MHVVVDKTRKKRSKVPLERLVYEIMDGKPLYYKGYKEVLVGKKTPEEVMSCSDLQGVIVSLLNYYVGLQLNRKKYLLATNEAGIHLSKGDNLGMDLSIFEKSKIPLLKGKYFDIAPKIIIEVDIKVDIDLAEFPAGEMDYLLDKSQKLLNFGVEKVIWLTTKSKKTFLATNQGAWQIVDWDYDIEVMEGVNINIKKILEEEEISYQ
ncbi:MAG: Uma2 family endonuclease [Spirosomaceae bacterium]|jgi:Uma2 family endonuclease|nr:Uma2 family endonuclease [Spirosomataceae bacterium]